MLLRAYRQKNAANRQAQEVTWVANFLLSEGEICSNSAATSPPQLKFPILTACHFDMLHLLNRVGLVFQTPNLARRARQQA
jgi:hypothetical protein